MLRKRSSYYHDYAGLDMITKDSLTRLIDKRHFQDLLLLFFFFFNSAVFEENVEVSS